MFPSSFKKITAGNLVAKNLCGLEDGATNTIFSSGAESWTKKGTRSEVRSFVLGVGGGATAEGIGK